MAGRNQNKAGSFSLLCVLTFAAIIYLFISREWDAGALMKTPSVPKVESAAAFMLDLESGEVLYAKNSQAPLPPASMSKMMTELIVLEQVNRGEIAWSDKVTISNYAAEVIGSQGGFEAGEQFTVRELFESMTVSSANDAAVALAEYIAGSESEFVELMNRKASALGLSDTAVFGNATGLTINDIRVHSEAAAQQETYLTAEDTGRLAAYLLKKYPEVLDVTKRNHIVLHSSGQTLGATNLMLQGQSFAYSGNDGLKTGYTARAGYCFTGTAKRDGRRLITVVMGSDTPEQRFLETELLLDYGFSS